MYDPDCAKEKKYFESFIVSSIWEKKKKINQEEMRSVYDETHPDQKSYRK